MAAEGTVGGKLFWWHSTCQMRLAGQGGMTRRQLGRAPMHRPWMIPEVAMRGWAILGFGASERLFHCISPQQLARRQSDEASPSSQENGCVMKKGGQQAMKMTREGASADLFWQTVLDDASGTWRSGEHRKHSLMSHGLGVVAGYFSSTVSTINLL